MTGQTTEPRVWLITGASRGLGREFMRSALQAGDRVVALSRTAGDPLGESGGERVLSLQADVTDRAAVFAAVAAAIDTFGRIDIVVNNAGTMSYGFVEEFTEAQARSQMETNFFGSLWVAQAVMPVLREQRSGHIIQISSIGGLAGFPLTGLYSASKFAVEGLSEALAGEAAHFGVKLTIVEPGGYWTDLYNSMVMAEANPDYASLRNAIEQQFAEGSVDSDPRLAAQALMEVVDSENPPLRLLLGDMVFDLAFTLSKERMKVWSEWEQTSRAAEQAIENPAASSR